MDIRTPQQVIGEKLAPVVWEDYRTQNGPEGYLKWEAYYQGKQPLKFATEKFRNAFGHLFKALVDNYCRMVIRTLTAQLQLTTVQLPEGAGDQQPVEDWFAANRMDQLQKQIYRDAFLFGNAFVIVAPDPQNPDVFRMFPQDPFAMRALYDPETPGTIRFALKCWKTLESTWRLAIYTKDGIWRYESAPVDIRETTLPDGLNRFSSMAEPFLAYPQPGMPVFHFANDPDRFGQGHSELTDIAPMQDALNKTLNDMMVGSEFNAMGQRWATGVEPQIEEATGKEMPPFEMGANRLLWSSSPDVKFGEFSPSDLAPYTATAEQFRIEIARIARIPLHYLLEMNDNFPSGEALKTAHQPLIDRTKDSQTVWGNRWEDLTGYYLTAIHRPIEKPLSAQWEDISPRSALEEAQADKAETEAATLKHDLGVSQATLLEKLGYDPEAEAQKRSQESENVGAQLLNAFDQNRLIPAGNGSQQRGT